ncbi:hypothetical protein RCL1_005201 [Eukaryota sp. TZLM3-RCL]
MDFDNTVKIVAIGNGTVGKTSLAQRFCNGSFTSNYKKTIAVDFLEKVLYFEDHEQELTFNVYDTAGQEEYDSLTSTYYRGAQGALVVFATDNRSSFDNVESWVEKLMAHCDRIPIALVQNKIDLVDSSVVTDEEAQQKAQSLGVPLFRTSAKINANVTDVFQYLGEQFIDQKGETVDETVEELVNKNDSTSVNQLISLTHEQSTPSKKFFGFSCSLL